MTINAEGEVDSDVALVLTSSTLPFKDACYSEQSRCSTDLFKAALFKSTPLKTSLRSLSTQSLSRIRGCGMLSERQTGQSSQHVAMQQRNFLLV